jgi:hypothetical protein
VSVPAEQGSPLILPNVGSNAATYAVCIYIGIECVPRRKHSVSIAATDEFVLFKAIVTVLTESLIAVYGQSAHLFIYEQVVHIVTTVLHILVSFTRLNGYIKRSESCVRQEVEPASLFETLVLLARLHGGISS